MEKRLSRLAWYSLAWFVLLLASFVLWTRLVDATMMTPVSFLVHWALCISGIALAVTALATIKFQPRISTTALVICLVGLTLFWTIGFQAGRRVWFEIRKRHYQELLAEAAKTGVLPPDSGHFDDGPPPRFAFYWVRGMIDNWSGVVHDPGGGVMKVNDDPNAKERLLFGGELYHCEPLGGDWYLCWFT